MLRGGVVGLVIDETLTRADTSRVVSTKLRGRCGAN
eukprot:COSAG01_NODE_1027_length_12036_cov_4.718857_7_plen_36_part_00